MDGSEFLEFFKAQSLKSGPDYGDVLVRAVLYQENNEWHHALTMIIPQPKTARRPRVEAPLVYDEFAMLEETISSPELQRRLEQLVKEGTFRVGDFAVQMDRASFSRGFDPRLPSNTDYSVWPCVTVTISVGNRGQLPSGPLVAHGTPRAFTDVHEGIREWFGMARFGYDDSRRGAMFVVLPDYRLRIVTVTQHAGGVAVDLERKARVKGVVGHVICKSLGERVERHVRVRGRRFEIALPGDPEELRVFLTCPPNERLDWYEESRYGHTGIRRLATETSPSVDLGIEARAGEGPTMEFKPFIDPNDRGTKFQEVVRTVIAFANTRGGVILIGVDDFGQADGQVYKVTEWARREKRTPENARNWYEGWLRSELIKRMNKPAVVEMSWVDIETVTVLRVAIGEGTEKPYATIDKKIYVRSGATNRQADLDTDLREIYSSRNDVTNIVGMLSGRQLGRHRR